VYEGERTFGATVVRTLRPFGIYVHVPYCASICGYCDFARIVPDGSERSYADRLVRELEASRPHRPVSTVFFGGGTPTLLPAADLARILRAVGPAAEVTTEANPETVSPATFEALLEAGFTRVSIGMQHAAPHVLRTLERVHTPGRAAEAAREARAAGFDHVSLDLIYGTPGETAADWAATLEAALAAEPDHVSAYALVVEDGTRMAAQVRRGELPLPDDDAMADRYEAADAALSGAGLPWYEVSNWAAADDARCAHNLGYWRSHDWLGLGPGAHSHVDGARWWNHRHVGRWAAAVDAGEAPEAGREVLDDETRRVERVMLETRTTDGVPLDLVPAAHVRALQDEGLLDGQARLTLRGRLLADHVVRRLLD
jgi:putative oxygen-independent coproporphyrinogen III oxidase